jgi:hypothetical protein
MRNFLGTASRIVTVEPYTTVSFGRTYGFY